MNSVIQRHSKEILAAIRDERYDVHANGVLSVFGGAALFAGEYIEGVRGDIRRHRNLIVDQGLIYLLNTGLGSTAKITAWYLAPFSGSTAPAAGWTAANFTANSTEITSTTEGFSETTRQAVTFTDATSSDQIDNYSSKATFTIVTASSLTVTGLGLLSSNVRGGTSGKLLSASKFTIARVLQNGDPWQTGYRLIGATP